MGNCVDRSRKTQDTNFRLDSCHDGTCVRDLTMRHLEFETPTRTNPVFRNIAPMAGDTPLNKLSGRVPQSSPSLGAGYYPPNRDQIRKTKPPMGSTGKQ